MAKQGITTGSTPNDGTGDTLLAGAVKINSNFNELYTYLGNGSNLNYIGGRWSNTNVGISTLSNVGIGTTNPTSALTVTGDTKIVGVLTANTFIGNVTGNLTGNVTGTASTASVAQALTGTPTISVADVTASGKVSAGGSVTGATIHGNGAGLSNIVTSITAGAGVTVSGSTGTITISSASGGAQGYFQKNVTGINTTSNVGIGTTTATSTLTVTGSGKFTGIVTASQFVGALTGNASSATALQTGREIGGVIFDGTGNINLPGVNAAGNQNTTGTAGGLSGTPSISVSVVSASSTITAAKFVGDGAGLTGVTASGTGIVIKDGGSLVGTAGTIDFGTALSVTAISGAAVTVTASTPNNLTPATLVVAGVTTATGGIEVPDNAVIKLGTDDDLQLYKDASHSRIRNATNDLSLQSDSIALRNYEGTQNYVTGTENAAVDLYFSGNKKAETTNEGLKITGITSTTSLEVNSRYGVSSGFGTFVASAGVAHTVDTYTIATNNFKTAEYTLHLEETTNSQTEKVLVMQNGTTAFSNEYAVMYNGNLLVSIGSRVVGGAVKLEVTPRAGISGLTTYRFTRETMK